MTIDFPPLRDLSRLRLDPIKSMQSPPSTVRKGQRKAYLLKKFSSKKKNDNIKQSRKSIEPIQSLLKTQSCTKLRSQSYRASLKSISKFKPDFPDFNNLAIKIINSSMVNKSMLCQIMNNNSIFQDPLRYNSIQNIYNGIQIKKV